MSISHEWISRRLTPDRPRTASGGGRPRRGAPAAVRRPLMRIDEEGVRSAGAAALTGAGLPAGMTGVELSKEVIGTVRSTDGSTTPDTASSPGTEVGAGESAGVGVGVGVRSG